MPILWLFKSITNQGPLQKPRWQIILEEATLSILVNHKKLQWHTSPENNSFLPCLLSISIFHLGQKSQSVVIMYSDKTQNWLKIDQPFHFALFFHNDVSCFTFLKWIVIFHFVLCSSRKYPYLPQGRDFFYDPHSSEKSNPFCGESMNILELQIV